MPYDQGNGSHCSLVKKKKNEVLESFKRISECVLNHLSHVQLFVILQTVAPPGSSVCAILQAQEY